ncbi:unnamed protein product [Sympodiomycopsis kandeliae]
MSALPTELPSGFAMAGSPYPPHPNSQKPRHVSTPVPQTAQPPRPPHLSAEVRQQELNWRQQNGYANNSAHQQAPSFTPGQYITPQLPLSQSPPSDHHHPRAASYHFTSAGRALSPPPPGVHHPQQQLGFRAPSPGLSAYQQGISITRASSAAPISSTPYAQAPIDRTWSRTPQPTQQSSSSAFPTPQPHPSSQLQPPFPGQSRSSHLQQQQQQQQPSRRASAQPAIPPFAAMPTSTQVPPRTPSRMADERNNNKGGAASSGPPTLAKPITDLPTLTDKRERALASGEERVKLNWARLVIKYVEREHGDGMSLKDPLVIKYVDEAVAVINRRATANPPDLDALYTRGDLMATGNFPSYHRKDPKNAFNDFEYSGRMGYPASWFRIGRDYENLNDLPRAKDAYERGRGMQDVGCIYRLGMAHLLGQISIKQDHSQAMNLLREAADLANDDTPQPAYIYGMLFAGEFSHLNIHSSLLTPPPDPVNPHIPASSERTALRYIEKSAYLNFAPAQYKLGWAYEYAQLDAAFDPLLSVQYYSLASKGGEIEADMAVSKWFLCGAEGCFDKNEDLAFTFAEKAARKGLATAEFALAYYCEVGVGCEKNLTTAMKWYKKASAHGNEDAKERLEALQNDMQSKGSSSGYTRVEYEAQLESRLTRKHTAAKNRSLKEGRGNRRQDQQPMPPSSSVDAVQSGMSQMSVNGNTGPQVNRQNTMKMVKEAATRSPPRHHDRDVSTDLAQHRRVSAAKVDAPMRMPSPSPAPAPMQPSTPSRMPNGGPASNYATPPPAQGSNFRSRIPSSTTIPHSTSQGSHNPSSTFSSPAPAPSRPGPKHPGMANGPTPASDVSSSNHSGATNSTSTSAAAAKKYNTFAEMGFDPKARKDDKDCVIM